MNHSLAARGLRIGGGLAAGILVGATLLAPSPAVAIDPAAAADELIALTNINRTSNGLPALLRDNRLNSVSVSRSEDMVRRNYFSHQIPPRGETVVDILESLGVRFRSGAENIEWNSALDFTTIQFASDDFMNSPSHRVNVLSTRWDRVGAGVAEGNGKKMYTVVFMQAPSNPSTTRPSSSTSTEEELPRRGLPERLPGRGDLIEVASARTGLIDSLVNRTLRRFLNL
jgi:uncharacterized protein YkwD